MNPITSIYRRLIISKYKIDNCIFFTYKSQSLNIDNFNNIVFLLKNTTYYHFGDLLFYIPLILKLTQKKKILLLLNKSQRDFFNFFIEENENIIFLDDLSSLNEKGTLAITFPYNIIDYKSKFNCILGLGLPDKKLNEQYPLFLLKQLSNFLGIKFIINEYEEILSNIKKSISLRELPNVSNLRKEKKYVIVSPYLNSGWWRDILKLKMNKIISCAKMTSKKIDAQLVLVGHKNDKFPKNMHGCIDLRGLPITEIMKICRGNNIISGVGFDNIWMHYFDLINKEYLVLFRGRILKNNYLNHMNSINVSFFRGKEQKKYI